MIKNGKFFCEPSKDDRNFKELFKDMVSLGVGRPVDEQGYSLGPWTPELLADAILEISTNPNGIDLRTVQLWFQENERGISSENIRWLARIFGCDDIDASRDWQVALSKAQSRMKAARRNKQTEGKGNPVAYPTTTKFAKEATNQTETMQGLRIETSKPGWGLARKTEALFAKPAAFGLPIAVMCGAITLGLVSFSLNLHSIEFILPNGQPKQVGFLWAPNWTVVFLVILPIYIIFLSDTLTQWNTKRRPSLIAHQKHPENVENWANRISSATYSFWMVLIVTVIVASTYNWITTHMIPLLERDAGDLPVVWGRIAIFQPETISISGALIFSGLVFAFNALCSYLFFSGLIILLIIAHDFLDIAENLGASPIGDRNLGFEEEVSFWLMVSVFRATSMGLLITILMKLQSSYLVSEAPNIIDWLISDFQSIFGAKTDDLPPEATSFITRVCGFGFHILRR